MNRLEKVLQKIKGNKILVAIILVGIIVIGLGDFSDAINKIQGLFGKSKQNENNEMMELINKLKIDIEKMKFDRDSKEVLSKIEDEIEWLNNLLKILEMPNNSDNKNKAQFLTQIILVIKHFERRKIGVLGIKEKNGKISELDKIGFAVALSMNFLEDKKLHNTSEFKKVYNKLNQIYNETQSELNRLNKSE
jgi:hypothetical protein